MHATRILAGFLVAFAFGTGTARAADCARHEQRELFIEAGRGDEVDVGGAGLDLPLGTRCDEWDWRALVRLGVLRGREPPPAERAIWFASFVPNLRHELTQVFGATLSGEIGIGGSLLSHTRINEERRLSTAFQFTEFAGLSLEVPGETPFRVGARIQHISNGGVKHPNDGITFYSLVFSRTF
jgi:hypothetical protein